METKICNICHTSKPISEFRKSCNKWTLNYCIICYRKKGRDRYYADHEANKEISRKYAKTRNPTKRYWDNLKYKFGIENSQEWYEKQKQKQNDKCAICNGPTERKHFCVDHNHSTNQIRGLLCSWCNRMIGYAKDDPDLLIKASEYLKQYQETRVACDLISDVYTSPSSPVGQKGDVTKQK